jgi:hypothetical protein
VLVEDCQVCVLSLPKLRKRKKRRNKKQKQNKIKCGVSVLSSSAFFFCVQSWSQNSGVSSSEHMMIVSGIIMMVSEEKPQL